MSLSFNDFQKQDIKFDITKLREACTKVLNLKGFDTSLGIPHFAGISLNKYQEIQSQLKEIMFVEYFGRNQAVMEKKFQGTK